MMSSVPLHAFYGRCLGFHVRSLLSLYFVKERCHIIFEHGSVSLSSLTNY